MSECVKITSLVCVFGFVTYLFSGNWKKALLVASGWGVYEIMAAAYDFILWPFVQNKYGDLSVIYLTLGAMSTNFLLLRWYQATGTDWLGISYVQEVKDKGHDWAEKFYQHDSGFVRICMYVPAKTFQLVIWLLNKNDITAFLFLSTFKDSFLTTAFLRHGKFGKLNSRDYKIFFASTIISCCVWGLSVKVGLLFLKAVAKIILG